LPSSPLRAITFIDGQNLFNTVKECFGYTYPNYDVLALSHILCTQKGWQLDQVRFYSGLPSATLRPDHHRFWAIKLTAMRRQGVWVFTRDVKYSQNSHGVWVGREKGVDVRLAIDVIRLAFDMRYDVAVIFSQDQDFVEAAEAVRRISKEQKRFIKIASAYPVNVHVTYKSRGINKTDWIPFGKKLYDTCIDCKNHLLLG
jgi:uncharacterized LabA/DUF88 family protein